MRPFLPPFAPVGTPGPAPSAGPLASGAAIRFTGLTMAAGRSRLAPSSIPGRRLSASSQKIRLLAGFAPKPRQPVGLP